ncbi:MAG: hypothetical protein AAFS12_00425 [Cyanobacteria bacterium J06632_19]
MLGYDANSIDLSTIKYFCASNPTYVFTYLQVINFDFQKSSAVVEEFPHRNNNGIFTYGFQEQKDVSQLIDFRFCMIKIRFNLFFNIESLRDAV